MGYRKRSLLISAATDPDRLVSSCAAGGVLSWVVISRGTISDYAEMKQVRKQRACEMLDACLDRPADYYSRRGK
jgi:hypothetical protein